jgi:hypothetical protein
VGFVVFVVMPLTVAGTFLQGYPAEPIDLGLVDLDRDKAN